MATIENSVMKQKQLHYTQGKVVSVIDYIETENEETGEITKTPVSRNVPIPDETFETKIAEEWDQAKKEGFRGSQDYYKVVRDYT